MDRFLTDSMDTFYLGDRVKVTMRGGFKYEGIFSGWDDIAIYINGLGYPQEDIEPGGLDHI
jgi:hypothetical protein